MAAILAGLAVALFFVGLDGVMAQRSQDRAIFKRLQRFGLSRQKPPAWERWATRIDNWGRLAILRRMLRQADLPVRTSRFLLVFVGAVVLAAVLIRIFFIFGVMQLLVMSTLIVGVGAYLFLTFRKDAYIKALSAQMPQVALILSNSLRAGLSIEQSIGVVADKLPQPAGVEFRWVDQALKLGTPLSEALGTLVRTFPLPELEIVVSTILIQQRAGGNLVRALVTMSNAVIARQRVQREVQTLTSEARFTLLTIVVLPFIILFFLENLFDHAVSQFFGAPVGWVVGLLYLADVALAVYLVQRIVRIEV